MSVQAAPVSRSSTTYRIAAAAIMTAVVTVFTAVVQIRNPASGGYFNLSDVAVIFAALAFGPWVGLIAGGLGTAISDVLTGYAQFAPLSFVAHGGEGFLAGLIAARLIGSGRAIWLLPAWLVGVVWMMLAYFVGESIMSGSAAALADLVGTNWIQALAGLLGIALYYAVRAAYPPLVQVREGRTWREL